MTSSAVFVILLFTLESFHATPNVCVENLGCLQGTFMPGFQSDKFEAFMGVPFAQPPVGELRFSNPKPIKPWEGILDATKARPDCIQKNYLLPQPFVSGDEDCLYLNIYRPTKNDNKPVPVMVYIFGGGFFSGTASPLIHGPEYFMDTKEVILVTLAYRLGALGFLSTGDINMPGNFGLKDQNLALKWVQNYISYFGGDAGNVTIFGQSAGAVSVHMHILSDLSSGLFKRAIVMSGNAGAPYATPISNPLAQARKQAELVGIPDANSMSSEELTKALREIDATKIIESGDGFKYWHVDPLTTFRPVIEEPSPDAFLTVDPSELIASGRYTQVPWMTGMVPNEGAVRALSIISNETLRSDFNNNFDDFIGKLMEFPFTEGVDSKINDLINHYFYGIHELNEKTTQNFVDMITDRAFVQPFYKNIKQYVETADLKNNPVFLYRFNYRGPFSYSTLYTGNFNNYGVVHCDDLIYLFRSPLLFSVDFDKNSVEAKVLKEMVDTFVSFAKTGRPKGTSDSSLAECNSQVMSKTDDNKICSYKEIKNSINGFSVKIDNYFDIAKVKLWDRILNNN
ncbi:juvenile hormone esterase-like [Eupeodes corollae]|uniref:juvenile hormone esterase-like n=1 Tax=Eupeodes corollae TaxID=290404 RepID=UPI002491EC33|nr:juvenile hormone esterase-like [Eupeodes corollae]XP_055918982.1 juvenile hormone esterase-like [Eupeodes corollae]